MSKRKWLLAAPLATVALSGICAQPAQADPLTPLTPNQIEYLDQLHKVFAVSHDPTAFRSDGELLVDGQFVCDKRHAGLIGEEATFKSPAITQLAFIYLCP